MTPDSGSLLGTVGNLVGTLPGFGEMFLPPSLRPPTRVLAPWPPGLSPFASPAKTSRPFRRLEVAIPTVERAGNINLAKINGPDEIRNLLKETAETEPLSRPQPAARSPRRAAARERGDDARQAQQANLGQAFNSEQKLAAAADGIRGRCPRRPRRQGATDADSPPSRRPTWHRAIQSRSPADGRGGRASVHSARWGGRSGQGAQGSHRCGRAGRQHQGIADTVANLDPS